MQYKGNRNTGALSLPAAKVFSEMGVLSYFMTRPLLHIHVSMESGLSLDPYSVPQRHTFYDSDEDDSVEDKEEVLALHCSPGLTIKSRLLLVCVSATAITLAQSYLDVERDAVVCKISTTSAKKVIKGRCFSSRGSPENTSKEEVISDVCTASGDGKVTVCLQREKLNSDFCNAWSEKVLFP